MENFEIHAELMITSSEMLEACDELGRQAVLAATADRDYKRERASALLQSTHKTIAEREAQADIIAEEFRFEKNLQEGLMQTALERVRCYRAKLSALQSAANMQKEAAAFERTGQNQER